MSVILSIVNGWTGTLGPFTLALDEVPVNLTGFEVTLVLRNAAGILITTSGVVTLSNQGMYPGELTYAPAAGDFVFVSGHNVYTLYQLHWKVVDGAGKTVFFPNDNSAEVAVYRA